MQIASTIHASTMAEIAAGILRSAPPRFQLAGISLGGYVCFEMLRQAPERVERLALLDTSARPDTAQQSAGRRAMLATAEDDYLGTAVAGLLAVLRPEHRSDPQLRAICERVALAVGLSGFVAQTEAAIARVDSGRTLAHIHVPTLLLDGDEDALTPRELSEEIAAGIDGATLSIVPRSGHASTLENPGFVNAQLLRWFANV